MTSLRRSLQRAFRSPARAIGVVVLLILAMALAVSSLEARNAANSRISALSASTNGKIITVATTTGFGSSASSTLLPAVRVNDVRTLPDIVSVYATLTEELTTSETSLKAPKFTGRVGPSGTTHSSTGSSTTKFAVPLTVIGTNSPDKSVIGTAKLTSGALYSDNSTVDVAVIGSTLASDNHLSVGSTFTAWGHTVTVVGIYSTGTALTGSSILMPLSAVQTLASAKGDVSSLVVTINSSSNAATATTAIEATVGSNATVTSSEATLQARIAPFNSGRSTATYLFIGGVVLALVILLLSALMFVGLDRDEIAARKSRGDSNRSIRGQFISQTGIFAVVGTVVGFVVGALVASPFTSAIFSGVTSPSTSFFDAERTGGFRGVSGAASGGFSGAPSGGFSGAPSGGFPGAGGFAPGSGGGTARFGGLHFTAAAVHPSLGVSTVLFAIVLGLIAAAVGSLVASNAVSRVHSVTPSEAEAA